MTPCQKSGGLRRWCYHCYAVAEQGMNCKRIRGSTRTTRPKTTSGDARRLQAYLQLRCDDSELLSIQSFCVLVKQRARLLPVSDAYYKLLNQMRNARANENESGVTNCTLRATQCDANSVDRLRDGRLLLYHFVSLFWQSKT